MTDVAFPHPVRTARWSPIAELRDRHPALAMLGLGYLMLFAVTGALPLFDGRLIDGVSVWAKPSKFFLSTAVFVLTYAWFFGYVRPERRKAPALSWGARVLIAAAVFELGYITFQAAQGLPSHYNQTDVTHMVLYGMMGIAASLMLLTKIPLALEIARRPVARLDPELKRAVVIGLWLTIALGLFSGWYMSQQYGQGHNVGAVGGHAPLFGWNRDGGDLRVAHFFGMHGEQSVPVAAALGLAFLGRVWTRRIVTLAAVGTAAFTIAVFAQAYLGRPFSLG